MEKRGRREKHALKRGSDVVIVFVRGLFIACFVALFVLLIVSVLVSSGVLPERCINGGVVLACVSGSLVGGVYGAGRIKKRTLLVGISIGMLLFVLLKVVGIFYGEGLNWGEDTVMNAAACLCGGGIAGVVGGASGKRS